MKFESQLQIVTAAGVPPLTVNQTAAVINLNSDLLDGQHGSYYQNASNLNAGTVPSARLSGSYGISITGNSGGVAVSDNRSTATTPQTINMGVVYDFKTNSTEGLNDGGTFFGEMTFRQYGAGTDWTGGLSHQLGFTDNGNVWQRSGSNTTWGSWKKLLDTTNFSSHALPLTGGTLTGGLTGTSASFAGLVTIDNSTPADILRLRSGGSTMWKLGVTDASGSYFNITADYGNVTIYKLNGNITTPGAFVSTVATGTAPLSITSTTLVTNLNADYLDGQHGSYYENRDTTAVGFSGGTLTLTRAAGNLTVGLDGRYLPLSGGTVTGNLYLNSTLQAGFSRLKVLDYSNNGTPTNGIRIATTIPQTSGIGMYTLIFEGYRYGDAAPEMWAISFYPYNSGSGVAFISYSGSCHGGKYPSLVQLGWVGGFANIFILTDLVYYRRFTIRAVAGNMSEATSHFEGWTVSDSNPTLAGATGVVTVPFTNEFGSATVKGALSVNGAATLSSTLAVTGAITQGGNQVLHAGNYNSYALPLSGGTLSGQLSVMSYMSLYSSATLMGSIGFNRRVSDGVIYNSSYGAYQLQNDLGTLNLQVYNSAGGFVGAHTFNSSGNVAFLTGAVTAGGNQVLHAGNYTSYTAPNASNLPYSWTNAANVSVFSGSYTYNSGVAKYLLLWPRTSGATGTNGRLVDGMLKVWRGANHAGNGGTVGYVHASSGYSGQSSEVLNYTPFTGQGLLYYSVVYNSVEWMAISMPVSDYFWEFRGHYGIQGDTTTVPILVQVGQAGVGTIIAQATGSPIITSSNYQLYSAFSGTVSGSSFSGAGTGLTGTAAGLSIGGSAAQLNGQPASYYENRDTTAVGFSSGTLTLTRAAGNLTVSLDGRYLPLTGGTITGSLVGGMGSGGQAIDLATNDNYASMRVVRNNKTGDDGMYIGYANANSGRTRIFGNGSTTAHVYPDASGNLMRSDGAAYLHSSNYSSYALPMTGGTLTGSRPVTIDPSGGGLYIKGDTGGWGLGYYFYGSSGTYRGGFGALGSADALTNFWIGPAYNSTWMTFSSSANNSQVALQQNGNQVLHAGNVSSYALPISGGTMTGAVNFLGTVYNNVGGAKLFAGNGGYNYLYTNTSGMVFRNQADTATVATLTDAGAFNAAGAITQAGNQVLHAGNYLGTYMAPEVAYTTATNATGYTWIRIPYASLDSFNGGQSPIEFYVTRSIYDNSSTPYGGPTAKFIIQSMEWHSGQQMATVQYGERGDSSSLGAANYITHAKVTNLAGGGYWVYLRLKTGTAAGVTYKFRKSAVGGQGINFSAIESTTDPSGAATLYYGFNLISAGTEARFYRDGNQVLDAGNVSQYALPISGGTLNGNLISGAGYQVRWSDGSAAAPGYSFYADTDTGIHRSADNTLAIVTGGAVRATFNPSGHVGVGVAPSTWAFGKAVEAGFLGNALWGSAIGQTIVTSNCYYNGGLWYYANNNSAATNYEQAAGAHYWYTAANSGASGANTVCTFGAAKMALDASGNLNVTGAITQASNQVLHAGNYTTYTVTKTGGGASGSWGINITGSAAQLNGQAASYYENRDITAVGFASGTLTLTRAAGNLSVSLDGRYLTGNQNISITGDATGSGTTSIALTLANSGVTAGTYTSVTVNAKGIVTAGSNAGGGSITLNGDVTGTGTGTVTTTIANDTVTNAKLKTMAAGTIKGNNAGVATSPADLTAAQVSAMLPGVARCWVTFSENASTGAITVNAQFGISSVTRLSAGVYQVNFSSAFSDTHYAVSGTIGYESISAYTNGGYLALTRTAGPKTTTSCEVCASYGGTNYNARYVHVVFHR